MKNALPLIFLKILSHASNTFWRSSGSIPFLMSLLVALLLLSWYSESMQNIDGIFFVKFLHSHPRHHFTSSYLSKSKWLWKANVLNWFKRSILHLLPMLVVKSMLWNFYHVFSIRNFIISGLMFNSLILKQIYAYSLSIDPLNIVKR